MTRPLASRTDEDVAASNGRGEVVIPQSPTCAPGPASDDHLPPLARDTSFWGMTATQFFGAFNDGLFKQLVLLLATPTAAQLAAGVPDRQGQAQFIFAVAFLMFSGFAGYVSDRYSKRRVVICAKLAEIVIVCLGFLGFWWYNVVGLNGLLVVLFLMGVHSAFFGPAKYGILPELIRPVDLPRANGLFLMLTFLALIISNALASVLLGSANQRLWEGSLVCLVVAVFGALTALAIRPIPPAQPNLKHSLASWGVPKEIRQLIRRDHQLLWAIVVVAVFWMVGGLVLTAANALGKTQFGLLGWRLGVLTASIGVGIAAGCILSGYLSRGRVNLKVVVTGTVGTVITLLLMSIPGGPQKQLLGYYGSIPVLMLVGLFSGMFIVPVQVALQSRPSREEKGRMIATMNQCSWIGIILGAVLWEAWQKVLDATGWPPSSMFAVSAVLMLPVALFYRPKDEHLPTSEPSPAA
jgi:acyl-[acyl-carrier-protein]-phospholipid O-acyltransferase/long-chain-fatty-acid--[acyl-carrier-protein] ligase